MLRKTHVTNEKYIQAMWKRLGKSTQTSSSSWKPSSEVLFFFKRRGDLLLVEWQVGSRESIKFSLVKNQSKKAYVISDSVFVFGGTVNV